MALPLILTTFHELHPDHTGTGGAATAMGKLTTLIKFGGRTCCVNLKLFPDSISWQIILGGSFTKLELYTLSYTNSSLG